MFAHDFGNLKDCNAVLSVYGPDSMKKRERIVVKTKPGQESAIERHNIQLVSFSGLTECRFFGEHLRDYNTLTTIARSQVFFFKNKDVAEPYLLNQLTFCVKMVQVHSSS